MGIYKSIPEKRRDRARRLREGKERRERDEKIVALRKQGMSLAEIGALFDVSRERIRQIIDDFNSTASIVEQVPHFNSATKKSEIEEKKEEIKALLVEGFSVGEIVRKLGVSGTLVGRVRALLRQEGVLLSKNEKKNKIDLQVARRMRAAGATFQTIAHRFGVSVPTVFKLLERYK